MGGGGGMSEGIRGRGSEGVQYERRKREGTLVISQKSNDPMQELVGGGGEGGYLYRWGISSSALIWIQRRPNI